MMIQTRFCLLFFLLPVVLCSPASGTTHAAESAPVDEGINLLVGILVDVDEESARKDILLGIEEGLEGRKRITMPPAWPEVYASLQRSSDPTLKQTARRLALIFGDQQARKDLLLDLQDKKASQDSRRSSLAILAQARAHNLVPELLPLIDDPQIGRDVILALAEFDNAVIADKLLQAYRKLSPESQRATLSTLASRPAFAKRLLAAVAVEKIPRTDLTADIIRKIHLLDDPDLTAELAEKWGNIRPSDAERKQEMARIRQILLNEEEVEPNAKKGRVLFEKTCGQCHQMYGLGEEIGPDLTGTNRADVDYFLLNVVDPSAVVGKDYLATTIVTFTGQALVGLIVRETERAVTLQTESKQITIAKDDIDERYVTDRSMMPDGLLNELSDSQLRDLFEYMRTTSQVAKPDEISAPTP